MNNSKVFTSSKLAKANLEAVLAEINEYLTSGQGTTKIQFIGVKNKVLRTEQMNSNWTTFVESETTNVKTQVDTILPFTYTATA